MTRHATLQIEVQRRGKAERYDLQAAPALVGSASHCDVRLSPDEAADCHLSIEPEGQGLRVRALQQEPPCTHLGAPFSELVLEAPGSLQLGALSIRVALIEAPSGRERKATSFEIGRQVVMVIGLFVFAYVVLYRPAPQRAFDSAHAAPALFADEAPRCPQHDREMARAFAEEQRIAADGKRERSPFDLRDGVEAVPLYELAAACFEVAEDDQAAREATQAARELRQKMEDELHTRHVRLEWFIGRAKYAAAQREVRRLRAMLAGSQDPYGQWLSIVERELGALLEKKERS